MNTSTKPTGFNYGTKRIYFVEPMGKDISFPRWRACLYYAHHLALTAFFESESDYQSFLEEAANHTYADYWDYRKDFV